MPDTTQTLHTVTSADGTTIAYDRLGDGPPVVLVSAGSTGATMAAAVWLLSASSCCPRSAAPASAGALLLLKLTGGTLNVYSQIGMVMLIGLITKNGILIVEFANQLQARGRTIRNAAVEAATLRLRPILMTTLTMVFAAVPLALARGAGAESRQQIGAVIIGGLLLGTFFSLFVIPAVYTLMARHRPAAAGPAADAPAWGSGDAVHEAADQRRQNKQQRARADGTRN